MAAYKTSKRFCARSYNQPPLYYHSSFSNSSIIGYGFCEYQDQETALSAMRNLNTRELHGRNLRVDHATRDHGIDPKDLQASGSVQNYNFFFRIKH